MAKRLDPHRNHPDLLDRRIRIHGHNALMGCAHMTAANMHRIIDASTTTPLAKTIAQEILIQVDFLIPELKKRID